MKKILSPKTCFLVFLIFSVSLLALSKDKMVNSSWTASPVRIDGSNNDWAQDALSFEKKYQADYSFKNDSEYLYVLFVFKDPNYLSSVSQTGITIYFNTEGKKKEDYGVTFSSLRISVDQYISLIEKRQGAISDAQKNEIRKNPYYFVQNNKVINKKNVPSSDAAQAGQARNAVYRSAKVQEMIVYEFAIPLKRVAALIPGIGTEPGKSIKVGFEWGGMTEAMKDQRMKRLADQSARATAGGETGLTSERSGGRSSSAEMASLRKRRPKKYSFWVDVQLAQNQ